MALSWCSQLESSRPPDTSRHLWQQKVLEEYLRVIRVVLVTTTCIHAAPNGSIRGIMSMQLPWREVLCGRVASSCVILLGFPKWKFPRNGMHGDGTSPCCNVFREKEKFLFKMQVEELRGTYCSLPPCTWNFSPRIWASLFPIWE